MLASGNSAPQRCVVNLLRTVRGEVPYVRTKGIDRSLIDIPSTGSWRLTADAEWVVQNYEPRVDLDSVDIGALLDDAREGDHDILASIS